MAKESKHINKIGAQDVLQFRTEKPEDYHCTCDYCTVNFKGEVFGVDEGKYYSQRCRNHYYPKDINHEFPHLDVGHWPGYRFAVQNYTEVGDIVFDPTVGSGTAIAEAENNHRIGIGVELEFPEACRFFCNSRGTVIEGDTMQVDPDEFLEKESIQLLVNGTPYPTIGSKTSDAPERKNLSDRDAKMNNTLDDYEHPDNLGKLTLKNYYPVITKMYMKYLPYVKPGGYIVLIIKDMVMKKEPYLLHKYLCDHILNATDELQYDSCFIHRHTPSTMFMNTYPKRFPEVNIPLYQTAIVLRKKVSS